MNHRRNYHDYRYYNSCTREVQDSYARSTRAHRDEEERMAGIDSARKMGATLMVLRASGGGGSDGGEVVKAGRVGRVGKPRKVLECYRKRVRKGSGDRS